MHLFDPIRALATVSGFLWLSKNIEKIPQTEVQVLRAKFTAQANISLVEHSKNNETFEKEVFLNTDCPTCELARLVKA